MSDSKKNFKNCKTSYKIVIVGNSGTGKTSFCNRWMKDKFPEDYKATVMSDFSYKIYEYKGNYYKIQFWDIAGQDQNIYTSRVFTKGAHGCIIMTDITNPQTLDKALLWKKSIDENTKFIDGDLIPTILIQNKIDLIKEDEKIKDEDEISKFCEEHKFSHYFRTSCKNGVNINESMDYLLSAIIDRMDEYHKKNDTNVVDNERKTSIVIQNPLATTKMMLAKKKICCQYF
jgi:small GTP-binding protein